MAKKNRRHRRAAMMANDNNDPPPPPPRQPPPWVGEPLWEPSPMMMRRNPNPLLYGPQDSFAPPQPPGETPSPQDDEIARRFQNVERLSAELTSQMSHLRNVIEALPVSHEVRIGHNRGPELQFAEEVDGEIDHLIALLKDKGPRPPQADLALITEETKKTVGLVGRIKERLTTAAIATAMIGVHEVTKDLTAPLWEHVAHKITEFCQAIMAWISLFL